MQEFSSERCCWQRFVKLRTHSYNVATGFSTNKYYSRWELYGTALAMPAAAANANHHQMKTPAPTAPVPKHNHGCRTPGCAPHRAVTCSMLYIPAPISISAQNKVFLSEAKTILTHWHREDLGFGCFFFSFNEKQLGFMLKTIINGDSGKERKIPMLRGTAGKRMICCSSIYIHVCRYTCVCKHF